MADVIYRPITGPGSGIAAILRSAAMQRYMEQVGAQAAAAARQNTPTPDAISHKTVMAFNRWCVNVINDAPDAVRQEYGTQRTPPLHPLGRIVDQLRMNDPNRRKGFLLR